MITVGEHPTNLSGVRVNASGAPAAKDAASSCLRRAAALAGLGLELWG